MIPVLLGGGVRLFNDIPRTGLELLRMQASPMPAYTTFGSLSATARAPTAEVLKKPSDTLRQCEPALVVFHTPPAHAPK